MMDAHIQFAPLATLERMNDPAWNRADRTLYDSGSLSFLPSKTEVPLLVDHDKNRQVGVVKSLYRIEWPDGPWLCASCRVTSPPGWLTRDTKASFAFLPVASSSFVQPGDAGHIRKGWITEVSILSPGTEPAEPRAKVTLLQPAEQPKPSAPAARKPTATAAAGEVFYGGGPYAPTATIKRVHDNDAAYMEEMQRRMDWIEKRTGRLANMGDVMKGMNREICGPTLDELYAETFGVRGAAA